LGALVSGYALDPPSSPNNFIVSDVARVLTEDSRGDIRDAQRVSEVLLRNAPDVIFHLAAQPIVQEGLASPRETFDINVLGTATLLDAVRSMSRPCSVVVITSDKCYRNDGQIWGFRESDPLGGHDPYSASKAGTELVVEAYRSSFFPIDRIEQHGVRLASVRAGNVIGGGDWAADRIVPDAVRALSTRADLVVRNPRSTRPWQHVLEPLSGYLTLAAEMSGARDPREWLQAWNFGPLTTEEASVGHLASAIVDAWGSGDWVASDHSVDVEAKSLRICIDKAVSGLGWKPRWGFEETVARTVRWYRSYYENTEASMQPHSLGDLAAYEASVARQG
jgi:CDP-glucose 4,6-dehydratase